MMTRFKTLSVMACGALLLTACETGSVKTEAKYPSGLDRNQTGGDIYGERESVFGEGGLSLFGKKKDDEGENASGITINSFLWRAALDTVSFMPIASADPFGGTILTDWYAPPENEDERFKLNVFILSRELRSDGVRVRAFKQIRKGGTWQDAPVTDTMGTELENTILTRARQMRVAKVGAPDL